MDNGGNNKKPPKGLRSFCKLLVELVECVIDFHARPFEGGADLGFQVEQEGEGVARHNHDVATKPDEEFANRARAVVDGLGDLGGGALAGLAAEGDSDGLARGLDVHFLSRFRVSRSLMY